MTKLITWNVNSVRVRMDLLRQLVAAEQPDIVCLQEVKAKQSDFPFREIAATGLGEIAFYGMPGYNGVAILSRRPLQNIRRYQWCDKDDARHIAATTEEGIEIHNIYIPAGGDVPDPQKNPSFAHKLQFIEELGDWFGNQDASVRRLICGDFNVAPLENDVWNHKQMLKIVSHTPAETTRLQKLYAAGHFEDCIRRFYPESQKVYSWWSYRNPGWQTNNKGRRLDHVWCSPAMAAHIETAEVLTAFRRSERPSDHVPVVVSWQVRV